MGFFDFLEGMAGYEDGPQPIARLNKRHARIVAPFAPEIAGARVLDLAAHDGRWSYALAAAGAAQVVGVEGRQNLIDRFAAYPDATLRAKVDLRRNDIFAEMEADAARGARYDVVAVFGILYHVMDHFRLFQLIRRLSPRLVIVDSEFMTRPAPMIQLVRERTDNVLNAIPQVEGQEIAIKGVPSYAAMEAIAEALGYGVTWIDWQDLPEGSRMGVRDYFRTTNMCRASCVLRPL